MKKLLSIFVLFICLAALRAQQADVPSMKYEELEKRIEKANDKLLVVNFWATTCAPCVKELPHFMEINNKYKDNPKFKMILV